MDSAQKKAWLRRKFPEKFGNQQRKLTVHVQFDWGWDWDRDVVVGGLAGEDGVEVRPFEVVEDQLVFHFVAARKFPEGVVHQGVVTPPRHNRLQPFEEQWKLNLVTNLVLVEWNGVTASLTNNDSGKLNLVELFP